MIDVKQAVSVAAAYFADLYADQSYSSVLLEEVEYNEDDNVWLITLGYSPSLTLLDAVEKSLTPLSALNPKERKYKIFRIDAKTGKVLSMKIRTVEHV